MNIPEAARMADQLARGRSGRTLLSKTNNRYITAVDNMNRNQQVWAREPGVQWRSLRREARISPVAVGTSFPTPDLASVSNSFFDRIKVVYTINGEQKETEFELVEPGYLSTHPQRQFCSLFNNQIVFGVPFKASDIEIGGTIVIPHYVQPTLFTSNTSDSYQLECDDPMFLVYMAARELVAGGYVKENRKAEFYAEARRLMEKMKEDNDPGEDEIRKEWSPPGRSDW